MNSPLYIENGAACVLFAYDLATSIDLDETERRIKTARQRDTLRHKRRAPQHFDYHPAPLRVAEEAPPVRLGRFESKTTTDIVLWDFGAVSILYSIPIEGPFVDLFALSNDLYDNAELAADSRHRIEKLLPVVKAGGLRANFETPAEDYVIFQIQKLRDPVRIAAFLDEQGPAIARILRAEQQPLSEGEIRDALSHRLAYGTNDVTVVDWNAALMLDAEGDDVRAVIEFANVELLELRFLDRSLDEALARAYEAMSRRGFSLRSAGADLQRIAQLQVDSAVLFEGVNNSLKLLGDQYLARVYRLASERFHLTEWDAAILRKLQTVDSIYSKISDRISSRRLEVLEWIIIVLIAVSTVLPFVTGK